VKWRNLNLWFSLVVIGLICFGTLMIFSASQVLAIRETGNAAYYLQRTIPFALMACVAFLAASSLDYRKLQAYAPYMLGISIVLLVAVFPLSRGTINGANRWMDLGFISFQPTEVVKLLFTGYLAAWFAAKRETITSGPVLWTFAGLLGVISLLVMLQPDFGTLTVILVAAFAMFVVAGMTWRQFGVLALLGAVLVGVAFAEPFRRERLLTFVSSLSGNTTTQVDDAASHQVTNLEIAISSGGWFGVGFGESSQKRGFLPEPHTDSIFAIIVEELGMITGLILIGGLGFIAVRSFHIAAHAADMFGRLWATGIGAWISYQALLNLAAILQLVPLKGIPLPLISYGRTNLVITALALGILLSIAKARSTAERVERANVTTRRVRRSA
jgi:cell division protein FtsW